MKMKQGVSFLLIFILGVAAGIGGLYVLHKQRPLIKKVMQKIERYRVARIPQQKALRMLADFEQAKELQWVNTMSTTLSLSPLNATSGKQALQLDFAPAGESSGIVIKDIFKDKQKANWEGFDSFAFDIYNPQADEIRLILKIKDAKGRNYQEDLFLVPQEANKIYVSISQLRSQINPGSVSQLNLFFWNLRENRKLSLDNIRLEPVRSFGKAGVFILQPEYLPKPGENVYAGPDYFEFDSRREKWVTGVPLSVYNPTGAMVNGFPVSGGVPFPKGELKSVGDIALFDRDKRPIPAQARVLGKWADGSIKWAQVDAALDLLPRQKQTCYLRYGPGLQPVAQEQGVSIDEKKGAVTVTTGPLRFSLSKERFYLFDTVWRDLNGDGAFSQEEIVSRRQDLVLVFRGKEYRSSLDKNYSLVIEERGPMKVTLKAEGWFVSAKGAKFCKFVARLQAFAGQEFVKVSHTFIYTGYPENKWHYLYKGKRLPANETVQAIYIDSPFNLDGPLNYSFGVDGQSVSAGLKQALEVRQADSGSLEARLGGKPAFQGQRMEGWFDVQGGRAGMAVVGKNLWEQFPKGWALDPAKKSLRTDIWPAWAGELDLKTTQKAYGDEAVARGSAFGLGKTHELAFYFYRGPFTPETGWNIVQALEKSLVLSAAPEWVYDTAAAGKIYPFSTHMSQRAEEALDLMFEWAERQPRDFKWYGMLDFGDTLSDYRDGAWQRDGRWGWMNCNAMGVHPGSLTQYLRTGEYKYFEFGENVTRHIMDVDTVHYNTVANDKRLKKAIFEDYSRVGSMHRHNGDHWGGRNEMSGYTNLNGILLYYFLTGDGRALDVAKEVGEFFLGEPVTYFKHPDIAPQRAIANMVWGLIELYEMSGDQKYKTVADRWMDVLCRGQGRDGTWKEDYNPETKTWVGSRHDIYTINYTLPALVAYHRVTGNKAVGQAIVSATRFYSNHHPYNAYYEASVYSYYLSGQAQFIDDAVKRLDYHMARQNKSSDPLMRGMIYQKAYYLRPVEFLYQLPFIFDALSVSPTLKPGAGQAGAGGRAGAGVGQ